MTSEPPCRWREEDGVIYFSVESDGTTGEDWITRLKGKGSRMEGYTEQVPRSSDFKPTNGVVYNVAVLKGMLFKDNDLFTENIRAEADKRKLGKPNAEVACLIREKFTDNEIEAMGLWSIIAMHEPINVCGDCPGLLGAYRRAGDERLYVYYGSPDSQWDVGDGFAFVRK